MASITHSQVVAVVIFIIFILSRAIHPMVIDFSKEGGKVLYSKNSPAIMSQLLSVLYVNIVAFFEEGIAGVKQCWQFTGLTTFGVIGLWYAFGDFLEMLSMGEMHGSLYQILLQSKLVITAVMMMQMRGTGQTSLQWHILFAVTLAVSAFVIVDSGDAYSGSFPMSGIFMVIMKVAVSCYAAVLSDSQLKGFTSMSMSAKLSQMSLARVFASVLIATFMEPDTAPSYKWNECKPFFHNWTGSTWLVTVSFLAKSLITLYLLKVLDSVLKNIGEALSCIVVFFGQILFAGKAFDSCSFLLSVLVVFLVRIYGMAPKLKQPAAPAVPKGDNRGADVELGKA